MTASPQRSARGRALRTAVALCALLLFCGFLALGTWQIERRAWKLDLIARVTQRVHAAPVAAPAQNTWGNVSAAADEYRHLLLSGHYLNANDTLVQAVTVLGSGFWVLTPLRTDDGSIVLVNRGFVPSEAHPGPLDEKSMVTVTGLLRLTEPGGGFLRKNDPAANRWYSRDVDAIATARGLERVAPYFIDADAGKPLGDPALTGGSLASDQPVGGLTVVAFHNSHLVYALTWYALALMVAGAAGMLAVQNARRHAIHRTHRQED